MTDYSAYKIPVVEGINDVPVAPDAGGLGQGCNGAYYIEKYNDSLDVIALDIDTKFDIPAGTTVQYVRGDGSLATLPTSGGIPTKIVYGTSEAGFYTSGGPLEIKLGASGFRHGLVDVESNVGFGDRSLQSVTSGYDNIGIGWGAGRNITSGYSNIAIGQASLYTGTNSRRQLAIGDSALYYSTATNNNTAVGDISLFVCTTGVLNSAFGDSSLDSLTTGIQNSSLGSGSGGGITTGVDNTCAGFQTLVSANGSRNTIIGSLAASSDTGTVNNNVYLGAFSGNTYTGNPYRGSLNNLALTGSNNILLGTYALPSATSASNEITLGNPDHTVFRSNVTSITSLSDLRDKTNVQSLSLGLDFLTQLNPITYQWDKREWYDSGVSDGSKAAPKLKAGFGAQELLATQEAFNADCLDLVYESNPDKLEATYGNLIPVMVKAIQELEAQVKELRTELTTLRGQS